MAKKHKLLLFDIDDTIFDTKAFKKSHYQKYETFDDVYPALQKLSQYTTLGILSEGDEAFQMQKLIRTKCLHFFQNEFTYIFAAKAASFTDIFALHQDQYLIYYIEDRLSMLEHAKRANPDVIAVWMKRGRYADQSVDSFVPDLTITSLLQLQNILAQE